MIIIGVNRRSTDKRSKIDGGRSAQHVPYSFFLSFFLSVMPPKELAPFSYIYPEKTLFQ